MLWSSYMYSTSADDLKSDFFAIMWHQRAQQISIYVF